MYTLTKRPLQGGCGSTSQSETLYTSLGANQIQPSFASFVSKIFPLFRFSLFLPLFILISLSKSHIIITLSLTYFRFTLIHPPHFSFSFTSLIVVLSYFHPAFSRILAPSVFYIYEIVAPNTPGNFQANYIIITRKKRDWVTLVLSQFIYIYLIGMCVAGIW